MKGLVNMLVLPTHFLNSNVLNTLEFCLLYTNWLTGEQFDNLCLVRLCSVPVHDQLIFFAKSDNGNIKITKLYYIVMRENIYHYFISSNTVSYCLHPKQVELQLKKSLNTAHSTFYNGNSHTFNISLYWNSAHILVFLVNKSWYPVPYLCKCMTKIANV